MANTIKGRVESAANTTTLKLIITHPMSIERRDPKTGTVVEGHFIEDVTIKVNGEEALSMAWGQAVSTNPYFACNLAGVKKGDTLTVTWRDNKGQSDSKDIPVN